MPSRSPVEPIALGGDAVRTRFADAAPLEDAFVDDLRAVCADVSVDDADRTAASRDWWPIAMVWAREGVVPARPGVVVRPTTTEEVSAVLARANTARVPVTPAAGRSGVCGAAVPVFGGVVLDLTGLSGIVSVDDESLLVTVRPGTWGDEFERSLRDDYGLTSGHWPQSIALSTVGGWVACRSAGQYSTRYGKVEDMVAGLEVVLADGRVMRTGSKGPRSATGPDLGALFVGSEGTLGVITEVTLRAHPVPPAGRRAAYGFATFVDGLEACRLILRRGATPAVLRLYDARESRRSFGVEGDQPCALIVLDEGDEAIVDATMAVVDDVTSGLGAAALDGALVERWLDHRNDVSGLADAINRDVVVDTCEVAGPWSALPGLYESAISAVKAVPGSWVCSAHQSHAYTDGACLYFTFAGQREGGHDGYYAEAWAALTAATIAAGCTISHHHGIGLNRGRFLQDALGDGFAALETIKTAFDPNGILNPGKLGLPNPFGSAVPWP